MLICMRTTIDMNDEIMRQVKELSASTRTTMGELVEKALRLLLAGVGKGLGEYRLEWHVEEGTILPGVVLDDRDALFDLMEGRR